MRNLVEKYAEDINVEMRIIPGDWPLDSLASGAVDLMIVPEEVSDIPDNVISSTDLWSELATTPLDIFRESPLSKWMIRALGRIVRNTLIFLAISLKR